MAETSQTPKSLKAQITRTSLVLAAAALLREQGPKAVTYRKVAKWAGAASSSVGYYFDSVTQLLHEAGRYNIQLWAERAEKAASAAEGLEPEECRRHVIDLLIRACLPDESVVPSAHYGQLIAAAESDVVTEAYQKGRVSLLVIKVLIAVLIHLCVVFPVVLVHPFDFFLTCFYGIIQLSDPVTQSFCHMCKIFPSVFYCCHTP